MDRPHTCALTVQSAADVHQAGGIGGAERFSAGIQHTAGLVAEHGQRGIGVLDGEGAAKPATFLRIGQFHQINASHRAQQTQRRIAEMQHTQAVAGWVVCHAMRIVSSDILDAQPVDQKLTQLIDAWREGAYRRDQRGITAVSRSLGIQLAHHADT